MRIQADFTGPKSFAGLRRIVRAPMADGRGQEVIRRSRKLTAEEFRRGGGYDASGAFRPWKKVGAFGSRPATTPPLGGAGSKLAKSFRRGGRGAFSRVTATSAEYGSNLIYADVQREGAKIGVTPKMRRFVRWAFGVNFRRSKRFVTIPWRRWMNAAAPQYQAAGREVFEEAVRRLLA